MSDKDYRKNGLRDRREAAGLSLKDVADKMGWVPAFICKLESGELDDCQHFEKLKSIFIKTINKN